MSMTRTFTRYIIQNENGKFYWRDSKISSLNGFKDEFDESSLYKKQHQAEMVAKTLNNRTKVEVKEVKLTMEID